MQQGQNSALKVGYTGCAPPKGDLAHHYHFQLFALDRMLDIGHVIAKGELVGTYQR
jgi:phosphatidylethanolamine-binding protein (PEBP) family uncharacterized protein